MTSSLLFGSVDLPVLDMVCKWDHLAFVLRDRLLTLCLSPGLTMHTCVSAPVLFNIESYSIVCTDHVWLT